MVTPRTNAAVLTPARTCSPPVAPEGGSRSEVAATARQRWFLARAGDAGHGRAPARAARRGLPPGGAAPAGHAAAPRAATRPARAPGERVAACALVLRGPAYLPLRTFATPRCDDRAAAPPRPTRVLGILGALDDLPEGWRALAQLVLRPAPDGWAGTYLRLAVEHPLAAERAAGPAGRRPAPP